MGCDRNDGDDGNSFLALGFIGAVVPKNAVSAWGVVLSVRLENFLAVCTSQGSELVRIKAWMVWVYFQVANGLTNLSKDRSFRIFECLVLCICGEREFDFPRHAYSLACLANDPRYTVFPSADSLNPRFTLARACGFW